MAISKYNGPGGWADILGEQLRGGDDAVMGEDDADVLGAAYAQNPAFQQLIARRVAASRPVVHSSAPVKVRDYNIDFGPTYGSTGSVQTITVQSLVLFRAEKLMAYDTASSNGTSIGIVLVGNKNQRPSNTYTPTQFFNNNALGNGIKWDTCQPALPITMYVSFIQACTFSATAFGKTVA